MADARVLLFPGHTRTTWSSCNSKRTASGQSSPTSSCSYNKANTTLVLDSHPSRPFLHPFGPAAPFPCSHDHLSRIHLDKRFDVVSGILLHIQVRKHGIRLCRGFEDERAIRLLARPLVWHVLPARHEDRKSTRLNSSHSGESRMPSSA